MTRRRRPLSAFATALATVAAYAGLAVFATPVRAADARTAALRGLVLELETFLPGLAGVGELAKPLPTLAVAPGGPDGLGLGTLLAEADTVVLGAAFDDAATVGELVDAIDGASDSISAGREVSFTASHSSVGDVDKIAVTVQASRTIASTRLGFADDDPSFSFAAEGGVRLVLTMDAAFELNYDNVAGTAWLDRTATTPSVSVGATASIPDPAAVQAGIGILAVQLSAATFDLAASVTTAWADPDNDGRLYFDAPGGASDDGELSAAGAAAGLVTSALASGSLDATLQLSARPSTLIDLGDVAAGVTISSANLATTPPQVAVTSGTLDSVQAFLTLSTRDLAQGLAQAASTVMALQNSAGTGLPFMRGDFANAIGAVEAITDFLDTTVPAPAPGSPEPGLPSFASLQDMLEDLDAIAGTAAVDIANAAYDAAKQKVLFTLDVTREPGAAQDLNPAGTPISGTATYTATQLTDASKSFSADLVGRQVVAGTSAGIIAAVSGNVLTLDPLAVTSAQNPSPTNYWNGGTPADGTPYGIAAADPKIGAVELGNALEGAASGAIKNANAKVAQATVTPSYTLSLPIVLDLRAPDTTDCDPGPGTAACPFSHTANGITRIIESLPLSADRIMLRTGDTDLLTADAPITTGVDIEATVGFLAVKVKGTLKACTLSASVSDTCDGVPGAADHLLTIGLQPVEGADADGDISFPAFVATLTEKIAAGDLADLVDVDVDGRAYANLTVEVPGAPAFFGGSAPSAGVTIRMDDIANPADLDITPVSSLADLGTFDLDAENPLALFGAILANLQAVQNAIGDFPGSGALDRKIPLVGRSFNEIIGGGASGGGALVQFTNASGTTTLTDTGKTFDDSYVGRRVKVGSTESTVVAATGSSLLLSPALPSAPAAGSEYRIDSELQGLINVLQDQSSSSLQDLLDTLAAKLGLGSNATFEVIDGTPDVLKLKIHWERAYETQAPMNMAFQLPSGTDRSLVGAQGTGLIEVNATGAVDLALLVPLDADTFDDPASALTVDPTESGVQASVGVNGDGVRLTANLGPFEASLGNPAGDPGTELQAGLGVRLASADTSPQTLSAFLGGLDVEVDGNGVSCDGAPVTDGTELAMCAVFPTYINGTLAGSDAEHGAFVVRLPLDENDLADTLDILGAQVDGHDRLVMPDDLLGTLTDAALNLASFGEGFYGYLEFLENALRTASFEGKLPLIGKDLQAGSDFVADLRTRMETALAGVDPLATSAGQIRTVLRTNVEPAMPRFGGFDFDVECVAGSTLATVGQPVVAPVNGGDTTKTYRYKVVAYTDVDAVPAETIPSDASVAVQNGTLSDTKTNTVSWTAVERATGYRVYRATDSETDYFLVADLAGQATDEFLDEGAADGAELDPATFAPCPDATPAEEVDGFTMTIDVGQGDPSATHGCQDSDTADPEVAESDKGCLTGEVPFDLGIPGLSLRSAPDTPGIEAALGWRLHLKVGLDREDGFFVQTQDVAAPEFLVGAHVDVGDFNARLAFINVDAVNNDAATPELVGAFQLDLKDGATAADCTATCPALDGPGSPRLTLDELTDGDSVTDFVKPLLNAQLDIDWGLTARPGTGSALPGISADFVMTWGWDSEAPGEFGDLEVAFENVAIDAGEFLGNAIKPIVKQIVEVFKPIQPVLDTLFEPIPLISDLSEAVGGDPVTIASLAETFSTLAGGPDLQPFLDVLKNVRDLLAALSGDCGAATPPCITVGSFTLTDDVVGTDANPATAESLIDKADPGYDLRTDVKDQVNAKASRPIDANGADAEHAGFAFPFLDNPESIFGLIVGQDVELVTFDSGPLTLGFEFQQSFGPVYAPPPVNIVVGGGASVTLRVKAGFDTYGIRTAIEKGKLDASILDSLYFVTTDDDGTPLPVVQFEGFLQAGASVSAVVIEVGVVGGIKLTISFYWNDPNNDGKFRFTEFLTAALTNPICLFNVGGELSLFVKVFITLGISPFSTSFDFTLIDVVILDFNLKPDCTPPPPKLGGVEDGVLYLFAGKFGGKAQRAPGFGGDYPFDADNSAEETWVIRQLPAKPAGEDPDGPTGPKSAPAAEKARVTVSALGITEDFADTSGAIHTVVLDGRGYTGALSVTFNGGDKNTPFSKKVVVATGSGADTIRTGTGTAYVDAGGGDDKVTTLERTDLSLDPATAPTATVSGGDGIDAITVGNGRDTVLGDRGLVFNDLGVLATVAADGTSVNVPNPLDPDDVDLPANPSNSVAADDADQIAAGLGGSAIYGNGGADTIGTANDNKQADLPGIANPSFYRAGANTIVGGRGSDRIKSGSADDEIYTANQVEIGQDDPGSGDFSTHENAVDTGTGSDTVYGSNAKDFVTTHSRTSQIATVFGGDSDDVIIGGLGTDALYGGRANDYLVAGPAEVSADFPVTDELTAEGAGAARRVTLQPITPPVSAKTLVGGGGKDRIYGVDGPATIFGDHEVDACVRQSDPVSKQPAENPVVAPSPVADRDDADLILGGAGVDTVQAGGGDDYVHLFGSADVACAAGGADKVFGGTENDLVYGGTGADELYGDAHDDELYANDGDDTAYGGLGHDRIQGNDGADVLMGGEDIDLVVGGTSKAGEPDTGDTLYGDLGTDTLIGDNADSDVLGAYPADLAGTEPAAGGSDLVFGGDGDDLGYGGLAGDLVFGGGGADYLEGNNASDTVHGDAGADDVIGGSRQEASAGVGRPDAGDLLYGGTEDDVITGDNAVVAKVPDGSPLTKGRALTSERSITLLDLGYAADDANSGGDTIEGGFQPDVILAQAGADDVHGDAGDDYAEGGPDADEVSGDDGDDDLVGGSYTPHAGLGAGTVGQPDAGDTISGGAHGDTALGDNGALLRDPAVPASDLTRMRGIAERSVRPYDLDGSLQVGTSAGADLVNGDADPDVLLGQAGTDRLLAGTASDYAEGGPDTDWVEGGDGSDDLVGGSSTVLSGDGTAATGQPDTTDVVWGQEGDDVITGDNAVLTRVPEHNSLTYRVNAAGLITERRALRLLDLSNAGSELTTPAADRFGPDHLSGQGGTDVVLGQDGGDAISGGSADDYAEGQGGGDTIYGDRQLADVGIAEPVAAWPGAATAAYAADGGPDGQDDLLGGSSRPGFRDAGDTVHGDGASDYVLGDNGTSVRTVDPVGDLFADRIYALRYASPAPAGAAKVRHSDPAYVSTRFCTAAQATCEPAGASGGDFLFGEAGDDFVYGQDGDDTVRGGDHDDDIYGELGNDALYGEDGEDAILGDRGGVRDVFESGASSKTSAIQQPPALRYTSRLAGSVSRVADLLHDVNGDAFVGAGAGDKMVYDGIAFGGDDRIRGGNGHDSLHAGVGDDLVNGDSGGDTVYGGDGADVLWGGKGCDQAVDTMLNSPDCYASGVFVPSARGTNDRMVDYVFGGKGATSGPSVAAGGSSGSDVIDWRPRGTYDAGTGCTSNPWPQTFGNKGPTIDPCSWFELTDLHNASVADNQHHQGIDWQYGGWDRDVLQADVADNGPNPGDRLLDWNGAYNLFTHCNAAYGGFNDVRELSPAHLTFIQEWSYGVGAGQTAADVTTPGTSAFVETAIVYTEDLRQHGSGKAYPSTPGHFDDPNACAP